MAKRGWVVGRGARIFGAGMLALACMATVVASASAVMVVTPTITGSGSVSSTYSAPCAAPQHTPNGTATGCAPIVVPASGGIASVTLIATPQSSPTGHWQFVRWDTTAPGCAASTATSCTIVAPDGSSFAVSAVFRDQTAPTLTVGAPTYSTVVDRTATLSWTTNEPLASTSCSIDGGAFTPCGPSSQTVTLAEGSHTFSVRGTDSSGNGPGAASTTTVRIVDTALASGPGDFSNITSPAVAFSSLAGVRFECSLDGTPFADCGAKGLDNRGTTTLGPLADGTHTFRVRARDGADFDRVPVVRTWTVDTVAPVATLAGGPGEGALQASDSEAFTFSSNEENSSFECRLDGAAFAPCASGTALRDLSAGAHRFEVRAIDRAGNPSAAVARNWSVAPRDRDGDGFNELIDCNDADRAIRPGALEVAGNAVDENCDGVIERKPARIQAALSFSAAPGRATTRFKKLRIKGVPAGATVTVTCKGSGCPRGLKGKGFKTKLRAAGNVSLAKFIKKPFERDDVLKIVISKPAAATKVLTLKLRAGKNPLVTTSCRAPGAKAPTAC